MPISIPEQVNGKSIISAKDDTLFLVGEIDQMDPGAFMTPIFETVKEQMDQMVKIDLTKLEYLNSSGIKSIVSFVMGKDPKYKIIFIADSGKIWQKTSLEVIKSLDENNIVIETR